jgi:hypothetical protein
MCAFDRNGFAMLPAVFGPEEIESLIEAIGISQGYPGEASPT